MVRSARPVGEGSRPWRCECSTGVSASQDGEYFGGLIDTVARSRTTVTEHNKYYTRPVFSIFTSWTCANCITGDIV